MKKSSIISGIIIMLGIIILAFTQTQTISADKFSPQTNVVKFHISGCDNCSGLKYCIDGGSVNNPATCDFAWDCTGGYHTIYVGCPNNKSASYRFYCLGSGDVQDVNITVTSGGPPDPCQETKH
jgi:hypothetical protein